MQVSYGSPGHKGVTHLMAVGSDELEVTPTDRVVHIGLAVTAAMALAGYGWDKRAMANLGLGGLLAFLAVRRASNLKNRTVVVAG